MKSINARRRLSARRMMSNKARTTRGRSHGVSRDEDLLTSAQGKRRMLCASLWTVLETSPVSSG